MHFIYKKQLAVLRFLCCNDAIPTARPLQEVLRKSLSDFLFSSVIFHEIRNSGEQNLLSGVFMSRYPFVSMCFFRHKQHLFYSDSNTVRGAASSAAAGFSTGTPSFLYSS